MLKPIGRFVGAVVRLVLIVVLLSVLLSVAVSMGVIDVGSVDEGSINTPEALPNWPIAGDAPTDTDLGTDSVNSTNGSKPRTEDPGPTRLDAGGRSISSEAVETRIHQRINTIRSENGLSRLDQSDEIATIARTYSYDMAERGYFSHVSPEGNRPDDRLSTLYPSTCRAVGENLAYVGIAGATDADELAERIVTGWMNSKGHRENVLTGRWNSHGIGVYIGDRRVYATQNFCDVW